MITTKLPGKTLPLTGFCLLLMLSFFPARLVAQDSITMGSPSADTLQTVNHARLNSLIVGGSVVYAGAMLGLYEMWYKDFPHSSFHFKNDNHEWQQMDKGGHMFNSYYIGALGYEAFKWAGVSENKSIWYGGSLGFMFLTVIEVLDGFSKNWGASGGDLLANTAGSVTFMCQQLGWGEQRIQVKWSVHMTDYAQYRPDQLGKNFPERLIKDYNGQVSWLSANIHSFLKKESRFPKWLNISAGIGADGMTGESRNPAAINGVPLPYYERTRKYFIAPDIDLSKITTKSPMLNHLLKVVGIFKFPLPTLEFNKNGLKFHPLYF